MDGFAERLARLTERIAVAARRSGRDPATVRLLGVTKTRLPEEVAEAVRMGLDLFGENKVQEARAKIPLCPSGAKWHFIGHLQSNKARHAAALFSCVETIDSIGIAEMLDREAERCGRSLEVMIEVNVSGERSKFGATPGDLPDLIVAANRLGRLRLTGLMTMAPFSEDPGAARPYFARLRELRDDVTTRTGLVLPELSMGMSDDFEVAVEEGSTIIRIGTALFGPRKSLMARRGEDADEGP
ncbi:MAG TPA: YggS family pyridoxal phosphate-dependent enzyme [Verrucomicrobiae bacterium]|nr:YggS family pyridoxal phosphate-dependent enzyme [Verrucomicrobiae bacterium]